MKTPHPGEILKNNFMEPYGITGYRLAKDIGIDQTRLSQIIRGKRSISIDTAMRLGKYFRISPEFWLNAQNRFDLESVDQKTTVEIDHIIPFEKA